MDWKIEVVTVPVSDVDRARDFYAEKVGFDVDIDHRISDEVRLVQLTPPGSACSIHLGKGTVDMAPGDLDGLFLVVRDVRAARAHLAGRGVEVGEFQVFDEVEKPVAGMFLVAPPYWGAEDWEVGEYALREDFASKIPKGLPVFLYHSRDDEWVPFAHLALYTEKLSQATIREFDGRGHQFDDDLSDVAQDIERL